MRRIVTCSAVLACIFALGLSTASNADPRDPDDALSDRVEAVETLASQSDLLEPGIVDSYANEYGVDRATATRNASAQEPLLEIGARALEIGGDRFSSTWLHHGDVPKLEIRLTDGAPDEALERRIRELSPLIEVTYGADERSHETFQVVSRALADGRLAAFDIAGIGIDGATGRILIDVVTSSAGPMHLSEVSAAVAEKLTESTPLSVDDLLIEVTSEFAGDDFRGGLHMTSCTTGFSVRHSSGTRGLITAGHCPSPQSYRTFNSSTWHAMTLQGEVRSASADLEWRTITAAVEPRFHADSTALGRILYSVTPRSSQGGTSVCSRGKTSGYRCGTVTSISYAPTWQNACPGTTCSPVFIRASASSAGGDSGGPWFFNNSGTGIHKGSVSGTSVYTPVDRFGNLGVSAIYG